MYTYNSLVITNKQKNIYLLSKNIKRLQIENILLTN